MSRIYGAGAAMGWTVAEVKSASMWEFWSAWHGFVRANTPSKPGKLSETEADALFDWIDGGAQASALTTQTYLWDGSGFVPQGTIEI